MRRTSCPLRPRDRRDAVGDGPQLVGDLRVDRDVRVLARDIVGILPAHGMMGASGHGI
jgi:hypothetical protein